MSGFQRNWRNKLECYGKRGSSHRLSNHFSSLSAALSLSRLSFKSSRFQRYGNDNANQLEAERKLWCVGCYVVYGRILQFGYWRSKLPFYFLEIFYLLK